MKLKLLVIILVFFAGCNKEKVESPSIEGNGYRYVYNAKENFFEYYGPDNKKIANIKMFDNGPDYYSEGLRRIIDKKKYGFINKNNEIIVKPGYDFASPFKAGFSKVANNIIFKKEGEHTTISGGVWGLIDNTGEIVVPVKYERISEYTEKSVIVIDKGKRISVKIKKK